MKDVDVLRQEFKDDTDILYEKRHTCRQFARTLARLFVSLLMANKFNDKVVLDLKIWKVHTAYDRHI